MTFCPGFQSHGVSFAVHGSSLISCRQEWQPSHLIRILARLITRNNRPFSWVTIKSALIHNAIHRHSNNVWDIKVHSLTGKQYLTIIVSNGTSISTAWKLGLHLLHYANRLCHLHVTCWHCYYWLFPVSHRTITGVMYSYSPLTFSNRTASA